MAQTTQHDIGVDAWTAVSAGDGSVLVQLKSRGPVRVHVGDSNPGDNSDVGVTLARNGLQEIGNVGLTGDDNVYVRALRRTEQIVVVTA